MVNYFGNTASTTCSNMSYQDMAEQFIREMEEHTSKTYDDNEKANIMNPLYEDLGKLYPDSKLLTSNRK